MTRGKRFYLVVVLASLAVSLFCLLYPFYVIRPFRSQGIRELRAALAVMQIRGSVTAICVLAAAFALLLYWRQEARLLGRIFALAAVAAVCLCAGLSRVNLYERMFHPVSAPAFAAADQAKLEADEKVLAVRVGASARAYPIRGIAYHHLVNDTLGGLPLVATY